ncbi:hypothetical protein CRYUN_Cryun11dG0128500 [Craigia yunnanensis]
MATNIPISLTSLPPFPSISKPRSHFSQNTHNSSLVFTSPLSLSTTPRQNIHFHNPIGRNHQKNNLYWKTFATPEEVLPSDSTPLDNSQQIVPSTGDEGVATIIQALLLVAFVALTILTIGFIYIAVQDFLEKREREKILKKKRLTTRRMERRRRRK